jgi:hypothetical protein
MSHHTCGCSVNSPNNHTCGTRVVNVRYGFFLLRIDVSKIEVSDRKTRVLMKNVCYLCALVLKIKYKQKCEDKIKK